MDVKNKETKIMIDEKFEKNIFAAMKNINQENE